MATLETMRRIKEPPYAERPLPRDDSKGELTMTEQSVKIPFTSMDGLPAADDLAVTELMEVFASLPRENLEYAISLLMRAAVGWERTGRTDYLTSLADDALVTTRLRRDAETDRALREAPAKPAAPEDSVDVTEALRERGLL
jgi:hypothetical protein